MRWIRVAVVILLLPMTTAWSAVVINEVFYNAPDDLEDLQWIELFNTSDQPVDLSNWVLDWNGGYTFPNATTIAPQGYVVVALNPEQFRKQYNVQGLGPFRKALKRGGQKIELLNAQKQIVDSARYKDSAPWPVSADAGSASLERICPTSPGEVAENWAASPLPANAPKPSGTPGKQNTVFSAVLPPIIASVTAATDDLAPDQTLAIEVEVKDKAAPREVSLIYRTIINGIESKEIALPMNRDAATSRYRAAIPAQPANTIIRYRVKAVSESNAQRFFPDPNDLRPTFSAYVHEKWDLAKIPFGFIIHVRSEQPATPTTQPQRAAGIFSFFGSRRGPGGPGPRGPFGGGPAEPRPPRGTSAFVFVDQKTGKTTLFDHVNALQRDRGRGYKVFFNKDQPLNGMSGVSIVFEGNERFLLAEAMAFDVYRRAGGPAPQTEFIRIWVDGRMIGYHLMIERVNKSFLRRNKIDDGGNLYKLLWYGRGIVGQHEKKSHTTQGHDDLLKVVELLQKTQGDEQWKVIQDNFNVNQVATYFAVNTVLSHWDGFFNNYFTYHDARNGKWEMYPWDQDKTWGYYDGLRPDDVFFNMPLTFGMAGDRPPGGGGFFGGPFGGTAWWRPAGHFSGPLLANPQFRKVFLTRTKDILDKVYTQEIYFPLIDETANRIKDDAMLRGKSFWSNPETGARLLASNVESLRAHLVKRRQFLLEQEELRGLNAGQNAPAAAPGGGGR